MNEKSTKPRIALDAMGGDFGATPLVEGALLAQAERDFELILVGDETKIEPLLKNATNRESIKIIHADDCISMDDMATNALKRKDSSIYVATQLVRNKQADALVSAGHSGATMSLATVGIGRIRGVSRPAICTAMPRIDRGQTLVIDAGANVDCKPEHLFEFAIMGYEYATQVLKKHNVRVGLLSNGEEECKGNELTKEAFGLLQKLPYFIGNIEGNNIFDASVDVVVCDGFVGNIVLKTSEGIAEALVGLLKQHIKSSPFGVLGALLLKKSFSNLKKDIDYAEYGGACLLGVNGNVIICHGKSNSKAIKNAIFQALNAINFEMCDSILKAVEKYKIG